MKQVKTPRRVLVVVLVLVQSSKRCSRVHPLPNRRARLPRRPSLRLIVVIVTVNQAVTPTTVMPAAVSAAVAAGKVVVAVTTVVVMTAVVMAIPRRERVAGRRSDQPRTMPVRILSRAWILGSIPNQFMPPS